MFAEQMVGPGVAIDPVLAGTIEAVAPVDGAVVKLHPHAYVVRTQDGAGVLVHLGIDTVQWAVKVSTCSSRNTLPSAPGTR